MEIKKKKLVKKIHGFTLIEFLIYSVIVSFMMSALVLSSINIMQARTRVNVVQEVNHNGKIAINSILDSIRNSESIVLISPGYLSLENPVSINNPVIFEVNSGILTMKKGSQDAVNITSDAVEVSSLEFVDLSFVETGTVRIILTIGYNNLSQRTDYDFESTFYATENIRK